MNAKEQAKAAKEFADYWKDKGNEKQDAQKFWYSLLSEVFGIEKPKDILQFEEPVKLSHTSYKDVWIDHTRVLIEQKGAKINLYKKEKQSDGSVLTPYEQAKRYDDKSPYDKKARWIIVCNFHTFLIHDMNKDCPEESPLEIKLENLSKDYKHLQFIVDGYKNFIHREEEISVKAGAIVGKLYDALIKLYHNPEKLETQQSLNILCVRLVFCLYAEDSGLFGKVDAFHDYLIQFTAKQTRKALIELFDILNTEYEKRDEYLEADLAAFPYVNGGLFAEKNVEIPQFTEEVRQLLLVEASEKFNWKDISPTIFGAVFESTLNPDTRRKGGMHYTSLRNIHKVIDPLFLDELKSEFDSILDTRPVHESNALTLPTMKEKEKKKFTNKADREYMEKMYALQKKMSELTFFDPACGSGNFLTETYISLRHLENKIIQETALYGGGSQLLAFAEEEYNPIKISISQFYGIEVNDFAVTVAKTALWIAESQMMEETAEIINRPLDFFPLRTNANIVEGNALRMDWKDLISPSDDVKIFGNPPFVGSSFCSAEQKKDIVDLFGKIKLSNSLDYVAGWYYKASDFIQNHKIMCAFVSTNSITQGEQVAPLWSTLTEKFHVHINFAYKPFVWDSESNLKAKVHVVIVGFSTKKTENMCKLYNSSSSVKICHEINGYLMDAPNVFVTSRHDNLSGMPLLKHGSKPSDGGHLILSEDDKQKIISKYPSAEKYIKEYSGGIDFLRGTTRYCLWLKGASPKDLLKYPPIIERVKSVKKSRLSSSAKATRAKAETPTLFFTITQPDSGMMLVCPQVSSGNRRYIPMGFYSTDIIISDKLLRMADATLFHFGVLESNVHNSWVRAFAGRLKSDFTYSVNIVYNNFPWPSPTEKQRTTIEQTAQAILDARALYPGSSLADLYNELTMPKELRTAHKANDKAVMQAYGFWGKFKSKNKEENEAACVTELMKMYQQLCAAADK